MVKLMCNNGDDKLKLKMMKLISKKPKEIDKKKYSEEEVDWCTMWK